MIWDGLTQEQCHRLYQPYLDDKDKPNLRRLVVGDLYFLLAFALHRSDVRVPWLFDRCREVEAEPDGMLDLWAREHYKSTIITFALTIQDILKDPETTAGIFSHKVKQSQGFLEQIMREFEDNELLKWLFDDVLYAEPRKESKCWGLEKGITVKRKGNPAAATVEAHGLVDGSPVGKHFSLLIYDDVVVPGSVTTPDMIAKTTQAWKMSLNLGAHGGRRRMIGTRYHYNDTYKSVIEQGSAKPRIHKATVDGTPTGEPVFLKADALAEKRRDMGPYVFGSQMLMDPIADAAMNFREEWLRFYTKEPELGGMNVYITVDPAHSKKKTSDYTVMIVHALGSDRNYYVVDAIRDRLNLTQRTAKLFELVRTWEPIGVGYEQYGLQADIEHIQGEMERENYRFSIVPMGGIAGKNDRIMKLVPVFEQGRYWLPVRLMYGDYEGRPHDYVNEFINDEYLAFPVSVHDDMLDCATRILSKELGAQFPRETRRAKGRQASGMANTEYKVL